MSVSDVQRQWNQLKCPIISGILFGTGVIKWIKVYLRPLSGGKADIRLSPGIPTDVHALDREGALNWTELTELSEVLDEKKDIRVCGGEGGMGGDGFVAVARASDNQLRWIAFFENSNPFVDVALGEHHVVGKTNLSNVWRFPLSSPEAVTVK